MQRRQKQNPPSPLWKKLDTLDNRSTSFPHIKRVTENGFSIASPSRKDNDEKMIDIESMTSSPRRTPTLTMALLKLHDLFDKFCNYTQDATYSNAQAACLVFDPSSGPNSPSCGSPSSQRSSSPSRSPITSWFIGTNNNSESDSSQKSEWEDIISPLIICKNIVYRLRCCCDVFLLL